LSRLLPVSLLVALLAHALPGARATELVYVPLNPSFGGSPLNNSLLNSAQAQDKHKDPSAQSARGLQEKTQLQQFNEILERSILSQLSSAATSGIIGSNGRLVPGTVQTGNFTIAISDLGGGKLRVTTTDKATGGVSMFEVAQ
jgi:curli production assembly/transport component CsgF